MNVTSSLMPRTPFPLLQLPRELVIDVLSYLAPKELGNISLSCTFVNQLAKNHMYWSNLLSRFFSSYEKKDYREISYRDQFLKRCAIYHQNIIDGKYSATKREDVPYTGHKSIPSLGITLNSSRIFVEFYKNGQKEAYKQLLHDPNEELKDFDIRQDNLHLLTVGTHKIREWEINTLTLLRTIECANEEIREIKCHKNYIFVTANQSVMIWDLSSKSDQPTRRFFALFVEINAIGRFFIVIDRLEKNIKVFDLEQSFQEVDTVTFNKNQIFNSVTFPEQNLIFFANDTKVVIYEISEKGKLNYLQCIDVGDDIFSLNQKDGDLIVTLEEDDTEITYKFS